MRSDAKTVYWDMIEPTMQRLDNESLSTWSAKWEQRVGKKTYLYDIGLAHFPSQHLSGLFVKWEKGTGKEADKFIDAGPISDITLRAFKDGGFDLTAVWIENEGVQYRLNAKLQAPSKAA